MKGGAYLITAYTWNYKRVFLNKNCATLFANIIRLCKADMSFKVAGFSILDNHFHLLAYPKDNYGPQKIWEGLKKMSERHFAAIGAPGHALWEDACHVESIRDQKDLELSLDYVHYDPVSHKLVRRPGDHSFSSFGSYLKRGHYDSCWGIKRPGYLGGVDYEYGAKQNPFIKLLPSFTRMYIKMRSELLTPAY
ncbi:MAG: transposase [Candidatus Omnitrophica bacterium]|nr:transposase [Candidatus Omnitrophota bacterium]